MHLQICLRLKIDRFLLVRLTITAFAESATPSFMGIPTELRLRISRHALYSPYSLMRGIILGFGDEPPDLTPPANYIDLLPGRIVFNLTRRTYEEARSLLYEVLW